MTIKAKTLAANRLKNQREKIGVSQEMVSDLLGVHRATVGRWETAQIPMPREKQVEAHYWLHDGGPLAKRKKEIEAKAKLARKAKKA
jgi:DNA-binding XRE family transcriptional regulator